MNINFNFLLLGTSLSLIPNLLYAQCAETDCLKLGYTSLQKCDNGLKCPFGEYWACPKVEEKAVLGQCTGYAKNCSVGQILNNDGSCSNNVVNGKTPIGVVVYISGDSDKCGYAMTASPIEKSIMWAPVYINTGTFQSSNWQQAIKDFNVTDNMDAISQSANFGTYPATYAAINYAPSSAPTSKGKWMLPTAGILNSLYTNLNTVNNAISKVGGTQLTGNNEHIWSSSEYSDLGVWVFWTDNSAGVSPSDKANHMINHVVRPVLAF
ncbi:MAG: hypothetical protein Q4F75_03360 [Pseudomonadota bacterium]|nr:hypothetical protein [Pseudomonadota bacterium]